MNPPLERSQRNLFTALALDRLGERREDGDWLSAAWPRSRVLCIDFEGRALVEEGRLLHWPAQRYGAELPADAAFLGVEAQTPWFAVPAQVGASIEVPARAQWLDLRRAAAGLSAFESGLFAYAKALLLWHTRARYCGACGHPTALRRGGHSARCLNDDCRLEVFPRLDAAIIVLVEHDGRCLLGRQAGWPAGRYSTLAGFIEPGESLEDAVRREVLEEAGVVVAHCQYHSSQPWPFPASLMLGYMAQAASEHIAIGDELEDARWFEPQALLEAIEAGRLRLPPPISISRRLIEDWLEVSGWALPAHLANR
jgi:NAD+ diphosphatase